MTGNEINEDALCDATGEVEVDEFTLSIDYDSDQNELHITIDLDNGTVHSGCLDVSEWKPDQWWTGDVIDQIITEEMNDSSVDADDILWRIREKFVEAGIGSLAPVGHPEPDRDHLTVVPPPQYDPEPVDIDERRDELANERYDQWQEACGLWIIGDPPGIGKTTTMLLAAAEAEDQFVLYLPKHENCREFQQDEVKPDVDIHLKGPSQPRDDECMDAAIKSGECPQHGTDDCPRMCPVFDLPEDHSIRERFEMIRREEGVSNAHSALDLKRVDGHGEKCPWQRQKEIVNEADKVVTVHNYMTTDFVNSIDHHFVDDLQNLLRDDQQLTSDDLEQIQVLLDRLTDSAISGVTDEISKFVRELQVHLDSNKETTLSEISPPELDLSSTSWVTSRLDDDADACAEALAWVQHAYREMLLGYDPDPSEMFDSATGQAEYVPPGLNTVYAAAAQAGLSTESARRAIAASPGVKTCPNCGSSLHSDIEDESSNKHSSKIMSESFGQSKHWCDMNGCGWNEADDSLTVTDEGVPRATNLPRVTAWLELTDPTGETLKQTLNCGKLPLPSDLPDPDSTLILDATPPTFAYARLFDISRSDVTVTGHDPVELTANVTQITDGQYHRSTVADDEPSGDERRKKFNSVIKYICNKNEENTDDQNVLIAGHSGHDKLLEVPENAEWMHFHAGRGLDRPDHDAIVIVGAPHANVEDLRHTAELLAMDANDTRCARTGDDDLSSDDSDASRHVCRKYYYEDGQGAGRAVETKTYPGLIGNLFRQTRERELEQIAHRVRPVTADDPKDIYLLTNVPTDLPVTTLCDLSELTQPVYESVGITEGAIELLDNLCDFFEQADPSERDDLFYDWEDDRFSNTVSEFADFYDGYMDGSVTEKTIRKWIKELTEFGLLEQLGYVQRTGYTYQATVSTLKRALLVLTNNRYFEVDDARQLAEELRSSDDINQWVEWVWSEWGLPDRLHHREPDPSDLNQ